MKNDIRYMKKYKKGSGVLQIINILFSASFFTVFLYRVASCLVRWKLYPLAKVVSFFNITLFNVDIDPRCVIKGGLYIPHPNGIVVGDGVYIGGNAKIMHGSTLGGSLGKCEMFCGKKVLQPYFEDNVYVGINSVVLGPIIFKGNCFIAATAMITKGRYENELVLSNQKSKPLDTSLKNEMRLA